MLKLARLTAVALSVAFTSLIPQVAFSFPRGVIIQDSQSLIYGNNSSVIYNSGNSSIYGTTNYDPWNRTRTVIINPNYPSRNTVVSPNYGSQTVILSPNYGAQTIIVNPGNSSPTRNCGFQIIGSPIPSTVPVDPYTGRFCNY